MRLVSHDGQGLSPVPRDINTDGAKQPSDPRRRNSFITSPRVSNLHSPQVPRSLFRTFAMNLLLMRGCIWPSVHTPLSNGGLIRQATTQPCPWRTCGSFSLPSLDWSPVIMCRTFSGPFTTFVLLQIWYTQYPVRCSA
jgi:hypothetical protein